MMKKSLYLYLDIVLGSLLGSCIRDQSFPEF